MSCYNTGQLKTWMGKKKNHACDGFMFRGHGSSCCFYSGQSKPCGQINGTGRHIRHIMAGRSVWQSMDILVLPRLSSGSKCHQVAEALTLTALTTRVLQSISATLSPSNSQAQATSLSINDLQQPIQNI